MDPEPIFYLAMERTTANSLVLFRSVPTHGIGLTHALRACLNPIACVGNETPFFLYKDRTARPTTYSVSRWSIIIVLVDGHHCI